MRNIFGQFFILLVCIACAPEQEPNIVKTPPPSPQKSSDEKKTHKNSSKDTNKEASKSKEQDQTTPVPPNPAPASPQPAVKPKPKKQDQTALIQPNPIPTSPQPAPIAPNPIPASPQPAIKPLATLDDIAQHWKTKHAGLSLLLIENDWDNFKAYAQGYKDIVEKIKDPNSEIQKLMNDVGSYDDKFKGIKAPFVNLITHVVEGQFRAKIDADIKAISQVLDGYNGSIDGADFAALFLVIDGIKNKILNEIAPAVRMQDFSAQRTNIVHALKEMGEKIAKDYKYQKTEFKALAHEIEHLKLGGSSKDERNDNLNKLLAANNKLQDLLGKFKN